MTEPYTLGGRIQYYRKMRNIKQKDLAVLLGFKKSNTLSKIENDVFPPKYSTLYKISKILDVSLDDLAFDYIDVLRKDSFERSETTLKFLNSLELADEETLKIFDIALKNYLLLKQSK